MRKDSFSGLLSGGTTGAIEGATLGGSVGGGWGAAIGGGAGALFGGIGGMFGADADRPMNEAELARMVASGELTELQAQELRAKLFREARRDKNMKSIGRLMSKGFASMKGQPMSNKMSGSF